MEGAVKTCPFCSYKRTADDQNPDWECPSCKRAYNKFKPPAEKPPESKRTQNAKVELRPAWRDQWLLIAFTPLLVLTSVATLFVDSASSVGTYGQPAGPPSALFSWLPLSVAIGVLLYRRYAWKFTIDGVRVSSHNGIIARNQKAVRIKDLRSVELRQGVIQRLLKIGSLAFYSSGSASAEVLFRGIENPEVVRDDVQRLLDEMSGGR